MPAVTKEGSRPCSRSSKIDVDQRPVEINNARRTEDERTAEAAAGDTPRPSDGTLTILLRIEFQPVLMVP